MFNEHMPKQSTVIVKATEWFARLALLNLMWLLFSLPIITILPATEGLYYSLYRIRQHQEKHPYKQFLTYFKAEFLNSYKRNWPLIVLSVIFGIDFLILWNRSAIPEWFSIVSVAIGLLFVLFLIVTSYYFAVAQQTERPLKEQWLLSFYLIVKYPLISLSTFLFFAVSMVVYIFWPAFAVFILISFPAFVSYLAVEKVLKKMTSKK